MKKAGELVSGAQKTADDAASTGLNSSFDHVHTATHIPMAKGPYKTIPTGFPFNIVIKLVLKQLVLQFLGFRSKIVNKKISKSGIEICKLGHKGKGGVI